MAAKSTDFKKSRFRFKAPSPGTPYTPIDPRSTLRNYPRGDRSPSEADTHLTHRLSNGSRLLQIQKVDHVIVGTPAGPVILASKRLAS
jgi:RadC-like JAB domain